MNSIEQARFDRLTEKMHQALVLQGKRPKTIDAYIRGIRRVGDYVNRCPDNLTADELKDYFASLVESHFGRAPSNSTVTASSFSIGMC
jgi:integrase/recombinase XerD